MTAALTIAPAANTIIRMNTSENSPLAIALFALILTLGAACGVGGGADFRALVRRQRPKPAQKGGSSPRCPRNDTRHSSSASESAADSNSESARAANSSTRETPAVSLISDTVPSP